MNIIESALALDNTSSLTCFLSCVLKMHFMHLTCAFVSFIYFSFGLIELDILSDKI